MIKRFLVLVCFLFYTNFSFSSGNDDKYYFHDVSLDVGVYPFINKTFQPSLIGNIISVQNVNYLNEKVGFRTGFSLINDLEGSNALYSIPIYFAYRTSTQNAFVLGTVSSIQELIMGIIMGLFPRNYEFNIGANIGYIDKDKSKSYILIDNNKYLNSYVVESPFWSTIDGGMRLNYKIWRFGIVISPGLSYSLTRNFRFESSLPNHNQNGLKPSMYFRITGGISFRF